MEVGFSDQPYLTAENKSITLHLINYNEDITFKDKTIEINVTLSLKDKGQYREGEGGGGCMGKSLSGSDIFKSLIDSPLPPSLLSLPPSSSLSPPLFFPPSPPPPPSPSPLQW